MKLLLHIGPFKTGTSAVQAALRINREALAQRGIMVPDFADDFGQHAVRGWPAAYLDDKPLDDPLLDLPWPSVAAVRAQSAAFLDTLEARVRAEQPQLLCLSSEFLSIVTDVAALRDRLARFADDITVSVYVRSPRAMYVSEIQQQIRGGKRLAELPVPTGRGEFQRQVIDRYAAVFGQQAMVVRNFHRDNLAGGDVVEDFRRLLGREAPDGVPDFTGAGAQNESLTGAAVAWLLTMNEGLSAFVPAGRRLAMVRRLLTDPAVMALPRLKLADPVLAAAIDGNARADCQWINATFLADQVPLEIGGAAVTLGPGQVRARLRSWLMSHITPEAMEVIAKSLAALKHG